jgi:hypothetical protein
MALMKRPSLVLDRIDGLRRQSLSPYTSRLFKNRLFNQLTVDISDQFQSSATPKPREKRRNR